MPRPRTSRRTTIPRTQGVRPPRSAALSSSSTWPSATAPSASPPTPTATNVIGSSVAPASCRVMSIQVAGLGSLYPHSRHRSTPTGSIRCGLCASKSTATSEGMQQFVQQPACPTPLRVAQGRRPAGRASTAETTATPVGRGVTARLSAPREPACASSPRYRGAFAGGFRFEL